MHTHKNVSRCRHRSLLRKQPAVAAFIHYHPVAREPRCLYVHTAMCLRLVFLDPTRASTHAARGNIPLIIVYRAKCKYVTSQIVASVTWVVGAHTHAAAVFVVVIATLIPLGAVSGYATDLLSQTADSPPGPLPPMVRRHVPCPVSRSTSIRIDVRVCALLLCCAGCPRM